MDFGPELSGDPALGIIRQANENFPRQRIVLELAEFDFHGIAVMNRLRFALVFQPMHDYARRLGVGGFDLGGFPAQFFGQPVEKIDAQAQFNGTGAANAQGQITAGQCGAFQRKCLVMNGA